MVEEKQLKHAALYLSELLSDYARQNKWGEYRLLFRPNPDWGLLRVAAVGPFPTDDVEREKEWNRVMDFLDDKLKKEPALRRAITLVLRTPEEIAEGGHMALSPQYVDLHDL